MLSSVLWACSPSAFSTNRDQSSPLEPAWHRRQRRRRAEARVLVRVAKAAHLLDSHHSSSMSWNRNKFWTCQAVVEPPPKGAWRKECKPCHGTNWLHLTNCRFCGTARSDPCQKNGAPVAPWKLQQQQQRQQQNTVSPPPPKPAVNAAPSSQPSGEKGKKKKKQKTQAPPKDSSPVLAKA